MRQTPASALRVEELERLLDQVSKKIDKLERMYFNKGVNDDSNKQPKLQRVHSCEPVRPLAGRRAASGDVGRDG